jgi:hypothetical protein
MSPEAIPGLFAAGLFLGMLIALEVGQRLGLRRRQREPEASREGLGAIEGAIFALLGLLVAFTFSGGAARFDARKALVVDEANAIGTAFLRIDLVPEEYQPALRQLFRDYLDSRIETYRKVPDLDAVRAELARSADLQGEIWTAAVKASSEGDGLQARVLILPALNQMIDITTTRTMATEFHPPAAIYAMLAALALAGAFLAGHALGGAGNRSWIHLLLFALVMAASVYVILDMEYPRLGFIRVDAADHVLVDLRRTMN